MRSNLVIQLCCIALILVTLPHFAEQKNTSETIPVSIKRLILVGKQQQAIKELRLLANQGHSLAQYQLAQLLLNPKQKLSKSQIKAHYIEAEQALKLASNTNSKAAYLLGNMYRRGSKFKKNIQQAKLYYKKAAKLGEQRAEKSLAQLESQSAKQSTRNQNLKLLITEGKLAELKQLHSQGHSLSATINNVPLLNIAIQKKQQSIIEWLISLKPNLNQRGNNGNTAFHEAAKLGNLKTLIQLQQRNINIDQTNNLGQTALMLALQSEHKDAAQWLINRGAELSLKDKSNRSISRYMANLGLRINDAQNTDQKQFDNKIISHQINAIKLLSKSNQSPYYNWPTINIATAQGKLNVFSYLLSKQHGLWDKNPNGDYPLILALRNDHHKIVELIINTGLQTNTLSDHNYAQLLHLSIQKNHTNLVKKLLSQVSLKKRNVYIEQEIATAIKDSSNHVVDYLLTQYKQSLPGKLLLIAVKANNFHAASKLLSIGIATDSQDTSGKTSLMIAAKNKHMSLINLVLDNKADIEQKDNQGLNALMWSAKVNCAPCIRRLQQAGADLESTSKLGNSALSIAANNSPDALSQLLKFNLDVGFRNNQSQTPLMIAVINKCYDCVERLVDAGANPRRKNSLGQNSYDLSAQDIKLLELLERG